MNVSAGMMLAKEVTNVADVKARPSLTNFELVIP